MKSYVDYIFFGLERKQGNLFNFLIVILFTKKNKRKNAAFFSNNEMRDHMAKKDLYKI